MSRFSRETWDSAILTLPQTNSITTSRPTKAAPRCKLDSVMSRSSKNAMPSVRLSGTTHCIGPSRKERAQDDKV